MGTLGTRIFPRNYENIRSWAIFLEFVIAKDRVSTQQVSRRDLNLNYQFFHNKNMLVTRRLLRQRNVGFQQEDGAQRQFYLLRP